MRIITAVTFACLITCFTGSALAAESEEAGRFFVKTVEYELHIPGQDPPAVKKMLVKIDTLTGKTWQYRAFGLVRDGKLIVSQYAWVPMLEETEDIEAMLRKSSAGK